jgi:hypothetical protein
VLPPVKSNCKFTALKIADAVRRPNLELKTRKTQALFAQEKQKKKERTTYFDMEEASKRSPFSAQLHFGLWSIAPSVTH